MQSYVPNSDVEQYNPHPQPQYGLPWVEEALVDITMVHSALTDPHAIPHTMANYGPRSLGAASIDESLKVLQANPWLFDDSPAPFNLGAALQESSSSIVGQYGPEFGQSNESLFQDFANPSAAVDGFSYASNTGAWHALKSNLEPLATSTIPPSLATHSSSPESHTFDHHYTPGSMETPIQTSPAAILQKTLSPLLSNIMPLTDNDPYLAAAGFAALPLVGDTTSLSSAKDRSTENLQWYGVEPTQRPSDGESQNGGPTSYAQTKIVTQQVTRDPPTKEEREYNDRILLEGKQRGETYKEIRTKFLGECPAESTLRGRYRVLTKALTDRVRKPVWTKTDIILLRRHVGEELERINAQVQQAESLSVSQKLSRISWKRVADNIKANGGTYQFGVTTCKKKWIELNTPSSAPRAPADARSATRNQRYG